MTEETFRKMASIQMVEEIKSIPEADRICAYRILGWYVVDQVGKYQVGDLVVFLEVDSWAPTSLAPFLTKPGKFPKEYLGVQGERLKMVRLRRQISQGLLLPLTVCDCIESELFVGLDVSFPLGIQKWEPPPEFTAANARGSFPKFIFKTDQERIQNCYNEVKELFETETWSMEEKADGSSHTTYFYNGEFGVCSRNLDLKFSEENTFWKAIEKNRLKEKMFIYGKNIAIQSELCGPGIQGNPYGLIDHMIFTFDIFDIDKQEYMSPEERNKIINMFGLQSVPIINKAITLKGETCQSLLDAADGKSVLGFKETLREGFVFKCNSDKRVSFKVISNEFLLKQN